VVGFPQALNPLKEAGARFGPDDKAAFVSAINLRKAERFLGALEVSSVEFNHLGSEHVGSFAATKLDWTVRADGYFSDGTKAQYVFEFGPFGGSLTFLSQGDRKFRFTQSAAPNSR
jgi:hypothetical protein